MHRPTPFITRPGQFEEGKESLAIGVKMKALEGDGVYEFEPTSDLGKVYYKPKEFLKRFVAAKKDRVWRSPKGSMAAIFPLFIFEVRENQQKSLF